MQFFSFIIYFMRKRRLIWLMFILMMSTMLAPLAWGQETKTLTINDSGSTTTNGYVPVYGYYVDSNSKGQFILPSASLSEMAGSAISKMTFSSTTDNAPWDNAVFDVYLEEVNETLLSSASLTWPFGQKVYTGHLEISNYVMEITLDEPFDYNGGNLKIGIEQTTTGQYKSADFNGVSASQEASVGGYGDNTSYQSFLPLVTFTYELAAGPRKPKNLTASNIQATYATLSWTAGSDETEWELSYSTTAGDPDNGTIKTGLTSTTFLLSGLTKETTYYAYVRAKKGGEYSDWSKVCEFKPSAVKEFTVNSGSVENEYVPVNGYNVDGYSNSQFILPASSLDEIAGSTISKLVFRSSTKDVSWGGAEFDVYMEEVSETTLPSSTLEWPFGQTVYAGHLEISDGGMVVALNEPFDYNGGNLKIGIHQTTTGQYKSTSFWGVSADQETSAGGYGDNNTSYQSFLPMVIFTAESTASVAKPQNLTASNTALTTATLTWGEVAEVDGYELSYSTIANQPDSGIVQTGLTTTACTISDLTAETVYYAYVRAKKGDEYSGWSKVCQFMTDSVITPKSLTASDMKVTSLTLSWTAGADETEWELSYSTTAGDPANGTIQTGLTNTTVELTGLTSEVPYYAYVRAKKEGQYSQWGAVCEFKLVAPRENLLINDGTTYNSYAPISMSNVNYSPSCQYIISKDQLVDVAGGRITGLTYYSSAANVSWGNARFNVYLKEVDNASFSSASLNFSGATTVYAGVLSVSGNQMTITFNEPFAFSGDKNLMVGIQTTQAGTKLNSYPSWYGENGTANSSVYQYYQYQKGLLTALGSFMPKTTITYIPTTEPRMPKNLAVSNVTKNAATLSWNGVEGAEGYELYYTTTTEAPTKETTGVSVADTVYHAKGLTTETTYYAYVRTVQGGEKSRWTLACEFMPSVLQNVALNDGNESNYYIPFNTTYINSYINEGTFIIPQANLSAVADKPWSQITLYPVNSTFALTNAKFEVYLKETDETSFSSTSFSYSGMTSVYAGAFTIADGKLVLQFNEPFRYSGTKNLQVAIKTTQKASNNPYMQAWYGTSAGAPANNAVTKGGQNGTQNMLQTFLPKMSVTYEVKNVATKDGFTLEMNDTDDAFVVKGYDDSAAAPVIPSTVRFEDVDYPVTTIGDGALKNHTALTEITIPSSITAIGENAFAGCTNMEFVNFEGTTAPTWADGTVGGEFATAGSATTWMVVPEAALADYQNAYTAWADYMLKQKADKPSIADVTVGDFTYRCIKDQLTGKATATITAYSGSATNLVIPTSVTYENTTYTVTDMGADVLTGSSVIFTYTAEDNHATLTGYYGTGDELTIPATVTSGDQTYDVNAIASGVFAGKTDVAYVTFERTTPPTWADGTIGVEFATSDVTYLIVPNATAYSKAYTGWADAIVTEKPDFSVFTFTSYNATEHTVSLTGYTGTATEVRIPKKVVKDGVVYNVTTISNAFNGNTKITKVTIPEGVTTIGMRTFNGCTGLTEITIPTTVTTIDGSTKYPSGNNAFYGCTNVTAVNFLGTVPPSWTDGTQGVDFCGSNNTNIKLYVPAASYDAYRSAYTKWRNRIYSDAEFVKDGFTFVVQEDGTLQITAYNGTATDVVVPAMVARPAKTYDVASIKDSVFFGKTNVVSVTFTRQTPPAWADGAVGNEFAGSSSTWIFVTDDQLAAYKAAYPAWDATGHVVAAIMQDGLIYQLQENGTDVHVIGYNGTDIELTIPSTLSYNGKTYQVTAISADAFANKNDVAYVHFEGSTPLPWADGNTGKEFATADATCLIVPAADIEAYKTAYPAWAEAIVSEKPDYSMFTFSYDDKTKTAKLTGYNGNAEVVKIPFKVVNNGVAYTVTQIDQQVFESNNFTKQTFKKVILPHTLVKIGSWAFRNVTSLEEIVLPEGLTTIGREAFAGCTGLTTVTIPASVTLIEQQGFEGCTGVTDVYFERTTPTSWSHFESEFNTPSNTKLHVPTESLEAYRQAYSSWSSSLMAANGQFIVDSITYVVTNNGENPTVMVYDYDRSMRVVNIPETVVFAGQTYTVTEIAKLDYNFNGDTESPFAGNSSHKNTTLEEVSIPTTVKNLDAHTFLYCTSLKKATIGAAECGEYLFSECTSLEEVTFTGAKTMNPRTVADIPAGVTLKYPAIEVFDGGLQFVDNVTVICENAHTLKSLGATNGTKNIDFRLPNCSHIGDRVFYKTVWMRGGSMPSFKNISLGSCIETIGEYVFAECVFDSLHFDDQTLQAFQCAQELGKGAFMATQLPETMTFPNLLSVPDSAFFATAGIKELHLPVVKTVADNAFSFQSIINGCSFDDSLRVVTMPEATTLGDSIFYNRHLITDLDLPNVTSAGVSIMPQGIVNVYMDALETAKYPMFTEIVSPKLQYASFASLKEVPKNFFLYQSVKEVNLPSVETVGDSAFSMCGIKTLTLPEATNIGNGAFSRAINLQTLIVPKVSQIGSWFGNRYEWAWSQYLDTGGLTVDWWYDTQKHIYWMKNLWPSYYEPGLLVSAPEATEIVDGAFQGIRTLNGLNAPNVTKVGDRAFYGATSTAELNIPLLEEIGDSAFMQASVPNITVPYTLTKIGKSAFNGTCMEVVRWYSNVNIPDSCFANNHCLFYAVIGDELLLNNEMTTTSVGPEEIGDGAFLNCTYLKDVSIGNAVKTIGADFLKYDRSIQQLVIPSYVTTIRDGFLQGCDHLRKVYLFNQPADLQGKTDNVVMKTARQDTLTYMLDEDTGDTLYTFTRAKMPPTYERNYIHSFMPSANYDPRSWLYYANEAVHQQDPNMYFNGQAVIGTVAQADAYHNSLYAKIKKASTDGQDENMIISPDRRPAWLKEMYGADDNVYIQLNPGEHVNNCTFYVNDNETYHNYINAVNSSGEKIWERLDSLSAYNLIGTDGWAKYTGYELTDSIIDVFLPHHKGTLPIYSLYPSSAGALAYPPLGNNGLQYYSTDPNYPGDYLKHRIDVGYPLLILENCKDVYAEWAGDVDWIRSHHSNTLVSGCFISQTVHGNGEATKLGDNYFNTILLREKNFTPAKGTPGEEGFEWGGYRNKYQIVSRTDTIKPGTWQPIILTDEWQGPIAVLKSCKKRKVGTEGEADYKAVYSVYFELVPRSEWFNNPKYMDKPCLIKTLVPWVYKYKGSADNPYWTSDSRIVVPVDDAPEGTTLSMIGCKLDHYLDKDEFYCSSKVTKVRGKDYESMQFKVSKDYGETKVKQFSCYFRLEQNGIPIHDPVISNASLAKAGVIFDGLDDELTDIDGIAADDENDGQEIYNLNGQRVSDDLNSLPAGVYIINGNKVTVNN